MIPDHGRNIVNQIKKECIKDHCEYIKSYIKHNGRIEISANYEDGVRRYNDAKKLLRDIAIYYPSLMAFLLDPKKSGLCTNNVCSTLINEKINLGSGKSIQFGGTKQEISQTIEKVKSLFESLKATDVSKIKKTADALIQKLESISKKLDTLVIDNNLIDTDKVLNNMVAVVDNLEKFDPVSKSYRKTTSAYNIYTPIKKFEEIDMENVSTLLKVSGDVIESHLDLFNVSDDVKKLVNAIFSFDDSHKFLLQIQSLHSKTSDLDLKKVISEIISIIDVDINKTNSIARIKSAIIEKLIIPYILKIKTELDPVKIDQLNISYIEIINTLNNKKMELDLLTENLNNSAYETINHMYNNNNNDIAKIRSNILPKLRQIIDFFALYLDTLNPTHKYYVPIKTLVESYKKIKISDKPFYQEDMDDVTKMIMSHLDKYNIELKAQNPREFVLMNELNEFVRKCEEVDIAKKISIFNEKVTSTDVSAFIEKYNTIAGDSGLTKNVNIFMAELYRNLLVRKTKNLNEIDNKTVNSELLPYHVNIIRELNVKKVRDLVLNKTLDDFSKTRYIFDTILTRVYGYGQKTDQKMLIINSLRNSESLQKIININIITDNDARHFIHTYNMTVSNLDTTALINLGLPPDIKLIPQVYFLRDYTDRVHNNIFKNINENLQHKADILEELVDHLSTDDAKTGKPDFIYSPDFKMINSLSKNKNMFLKGGSIENVTKQIEYLAKLKIEYAESVRHYVNASDKYVIAYNELYSYTRYLILIATNQFFTENYVIYKYLNKSMIELYKRITKRIIRDLDSGVTEPHIEFVRKYYNVIVRRLGNFLDKLSYFVRDPTELIDIRNIDDTSREIRADLILLNYFKPIIESYNEMFQNQITIYARLNDIAGEIDYQSKVFVSDHEKFKNSGCGYQILNKKFDSDLIQDLCVPTKTANVDMGGDSTVMWSRLYACKAKSLKLDNDEVITMGNFLFPNEKPVIFTEVFDSVNFPENSDISKYMTLETQLAKKKGVCMLTYGYSGTGKTYTLFGNKNKQGILQSTLVNINGLYKVKFRLFEIYGRGLPYDFYWNSPGKSRINDIDHSIYHYVLENTGTNIQVQNTEEDLIAVKPKQFLSYIENAKFGLLDNTYITIPKKDVKNVFNNFSEFTESIDKYRKGELGNSKIKNILRIRETPNNPESSRSILVYDFKLYIGNEKNTNTSSGINNGYDDDDDENDAVKFLIVDLPGREEINQTYIEPYLNNPVIKNILDSGEKVDVVFTKNDKPVSVDPVIERVRMIITCMALSPMAIGIFQPDIVINTINSLDKNTRNVVYGDNNGKGDITNEYEINQHNIKLNYLIKLSPDLKLGVLPPNNNKKKYGFGYDDDYQCMGLGAVYVIYRLIEKNRFDIIEEIYRKITDVEINNTLNVKIDNMDSPMELFDIIRGLIESKFKGESTAKTIKSLVEKVTGILPEKKMTMLEYVDTVENKIGTLRSSVPEEYEKIREIKSSLKQILKYDYLMTPLEGIYINENIIGLIKYLSSRLIKDKTAAADVEVLNRAKVKQRDMVLAEQRNIVRCWLMSKDEQHMTRKLEKPTTTNKTQPGKPIKTNKTQPGKPKNRIDFMVDYLFNFRKTYDESYFPWLSTDGSEKTYYNNIYSGIMAYVPDMSDTASNMSLYPPPANKNKLVFITEQIVKQQRQLISVYASNKIFNFDIPLITDILSHYIETEETDNPALNNIKNKTAIKDYKLFYLFGNYDEDQKTQYKCEHQLKLLDNTENFIKAIAN